MPNISTAIQDIQQDKHIIMLNHIALFTASIITIILLALIGCFIYKLFDKSRSFKLSNKILSQKYWQYTKITSIIAIIFIIIATGLSFYKPVDLSNVYNAHTTSNDLVIRTHQERFKKDEILMDDFYSISYRIKHHKIKMGHLSPEAAQIKGKNSPRAQIHRHAMNQMKLYHNKSEHEYHKELINGKYLTKYMSSAKPHKPHWYNYLLL